MLKIRENYIYIVIILFLIISLSFNVILAVKLFNDSQNTNIVEEAAIINENSEVEQIETESIQKYVEIKGQVENPGVYAIINGNIINDVIQMAGGLTKKAYTKNINLSKKVEDEMVIYVYSKSEMSNVSTNYSEISTCSCPTYNISSCVENKETTITVGTQSSSTSASSDTETTTLVNINTDGLEKLMTLSGIGEAKAKSIIEYRETNGLFNSTEDIQNVSGISTNIYEKIKDYITI